MLEQERGQQGKKSIAQASRHDRWDHSNVCDIAATNLVEAADGCEEPRMEGVHCQDSRLFRENTIEALLEPVLGVLLGDAVRLADLACASLSARDTVSWSSHHTEEVGAENLL